MSQIKVLPENLINQIAAGEVLERPVSAVKELLENSIDAEAKKIDIYIRNGGKSEITISDDGLGIEKEDLEINLEGNQLQIKGFKKEENDERIFLHRGIATRQFQRNFVLAEGIEVEGASMENGLLSVDLSQPINSEESKKIEIKDSSKSNNEQLISLENGKTNRQR